jgi:hypothetical protein
MSPLTCPRYVHANYRFVVDPANNYHAQSVDADEYLDWKSIWQILVSSLSQSAYCPICLGTPVAPRMAKCGHIFCLPCLIRYMHAEDGSNPPVERKPRSKACPLCWEVIYLSDPKPVRWYAGQENEPPREGSDIVLRLVKRNTGSTLALPRDGAADVAPGQDFPWHYAAEVMDFARIMLGTVDYMREQFDAEMSALEQQEQEDEVMFGPDNVEWTRRAVRVLKEAKSALQPAATGPPKQPSDVTSNGVLGSPNTSSSQVSALPRPSPEPTTSLAAKAIKAVSDGIQSRVANLTSQPPSEYYFYQALLHYYLSPLDIRILKEAFGDFSSFPATILPRIERVSTGHLVDDDLRKRAKWLGHLPRGCEVAFLECDWTDTVPCKVLEKFRPEIERRRKRKEDKEALEERARIRAERQEDEVRFAQLRRRRSGEESPTRFHKDDFVPLVPNYDDEDGLSSSPPWGGRSRGSAFASLANISTSPSASRTVWGTPVVPPLSPTLAAAEEDQSHDDGWLQGWEKDVVLGDGLVAEVQTLSLGEGGGPTPSGKQTPNGKKKKAKKITLMSTNVRRGA